jgi:DNA-binding NarL/FixJ family response regulator
MIDVLVEAASPDLQAELTDLVRDHPRFRLIEDPYATSTDEGRQQPDVVLMAAEAQGDAALESSGWSAAGVPVVLLVHHPAGWISEARPAGVRAVLPRNSSAAEIIAAIEAVAAGLFVFHPADVDAVPAARPREPESAPGTALVEPLTPREIEVLRLLAEGLGNKEIAARLNISEHTAKFHVASIMGKLGATSRTEAVTLGIRHGLVMI